MITTSACVDALGVPKEGFLDLPPYSPCGWLSSRISFIDESPARKSTGKPDPDGSDRDFEFRIDDPVAMLPADELFSDGKLMPLRTLRPLSSALPSSPPVSSAEILAAAMPVKPCMRSDFTASEFCVLSPKAPRCSSRWRELLGLKRTQNAKASEMALQAKNPATTAIKAPRSLKQLLRGGSDAKNCGNDYSLLSLPLISSTTASGDSETDSSSMSVPSPRLSLSSSSFSCSDHDEPPRFSLDSEKTSHNSNANGNGNTSSNLLNRNPPRVRVASSGNSNLAGNARPRIGRSPIRRTLESGSIPPRGASLDSPRMNSSGKIVFQSLERSSSSPSTFNGVSKNSKDPYYRHRDAWKGMERSYSANVRVTPLLNVPVCTLRASGSKGTIFGLFSPQKKEPVRSSRCRSDRV